MAFNENTRVKIPAILHLCRLGYTYISLADAKWDLQTNIFTNIFAESLKRINDIEDSDSMLTKQTEIEGLAEGSTGQTELSRVNLGKLKMIVPPTDLQLKFEDFIKPQFKKMANN
jgi:restriction endonuclease S subunit